MNEVLEHLRGMIAITQPFETERDSEGKLIVNIRPQGSFDQWERCIKLFNELSGTLAPYQSPRLASISPDGDPAAEHHHDHRHLHIKMPLDELAREYHRSIKEIDFMPE
jgi:hypothetical protein